VKINCRVINCKTVKIVVLDVVKTVEEMAFDVKILAPKLQENHTRRVDNTKPVGLNVPLAAGPFWRIIVSGIFLM